MRRTVESRDRERIAVFALVMMAACWGSSFPLTKIVLRSTTVENYLVLRFTAAAALMACLAPGPLRRLDRPDVYCSLGLGALYGCAQLSQVYGLRTTPASQSGFIIGLSVVITPVIGFATWRQATSRRTWLGIGLALADSRCYH